MTARALSGCLKHRDEDMSCRHPEGFTLLEMMVVVTMILIVASIGSPIYITSKVHAREAVLHKHLYTLRFLIERFTLDHTRAPASLGEIVEKGYLGRLTDPFTGSTQPGGWRWERPLTCLRAEAPAIYGFRVPLRQAQACPPTSGTLSPGERAEVKAGAVDSLSRE
jgi:prepilin-type N-terminal cleavage/methylation domain-containing protein